MSYTPWLRKIVNDIFLADITGYWKLGDYDNQALSASFRYFSLGEVTTGTDTNVSGVRTLNPYEFAFDVGYSRKLSDKFSMGVVLRYILSDLSYTDEMSGNPTLRQMHFQLTFQATTSRIPWSAAMNASLHGDSTSRI